MSKMHPVFSGAKSITFDLFKSYHIPIQKRTMKKPGIHLRYNYSLTSIHVNCKLFERRGKAILDVNIDEDFARQIDGVKRLLNVS